MTAPNPVSPQAEEILNQIKNAEKSFLLKEPGSREQLLNLAYSLATSLELPSESIQRMGWAEVRLCPEPSPRIPS